MSSIKFIVFLIFTSISFPSEISFIDSLDHQIHLIWWFVLQMHVHSLFCYWSFLSGAMLWLFLSLSFVYLCKQVYRCNLMMSNNFICFHFFSIFFLCFFIFIILYTFSNKACSFVLGHCLLLTSNVRQVLYKSDHGLSTFRLELIVITSFNCCKFQYSIFLSFAKRISWDVILKSIFEIRNKPLAIIKLDCHSLIIDHCPMTLYYFFITGFTSFAEECFGFEAF